MTGKKQSKAEDLADEMEKETVDAGIVHEVNVDKNLEKIKLQQAESKKAQELEILKKEQEQKKKAEEEKKTEQKKEEKHEEKHLEKAETSKKALSTPATSLVQKKKKLSIEDSKSVIAYTKA
jgi:hypothetical protein